MSSHEDSDVLLNHHEDDELSMSDGGEFSGFDIQEIENVPPVGATVEVTDVPLEQTSSGRKLKSVVVKPSTSKGKASSKGKAGKKTVAKKSGNKQSKGKKSALNFDSLSIEDIQLLKEKLGLSGDKSSDNDDFVSYRNQPNLQIQVDRDDISDSEMSYVPLRHRNPVDKSSHLSKDAMTKALFGSSDECNSDNNGADWDLPTNKVLEKGPPISKNLASPVNSACTSQCPSSDLINKYKVPENCELLSPPLVNLEIWKSIDKRGQSVDRNIVDIQKLVSAEMVAVLKLAELLKPHITSNSEAKGLLTDLITLSGQVQYSLSLRRRYNCRPHLKKKYANLCHVNVPITTKLFGDDITKEIKNCEAVYSLAKDRYSFPQKSFRGSFKNRGMSNGRQNRFQPYNRGQSSFQYGTQRRYRGRGKSSTVTSAPKND
jgi:hypothetical protein